VISDPSAIIVGDFNRDTKTDLAVANATPGAVSVLTNICSAVSAAVVSTSAASFSAASVSPESIVAAFGTNMATSTLVAGTVPLPTRLGGTTVIMVDENGVERVAPLFFVSAGQINYLVPPGMPLGRATVKAISGNGTIGLAEVTITQTAPGLFAANSDGRGVAAAFVIRVKTSGAQIFEQVAQFDVAQNKYVARPIVFGSEGDRIFLVLFGTGFRFASSPANVRVSLNGTNVPVLFAGAQPDFVGLDQVNLEIPRELPRGEISIVLTVDGRSANTLTITTQ
jgi:uncharacterized protein (TIGR03437 family)